MAAYGVSALFLYFLVCFNIFLQQNELKRPRDLHASDSHHRKTEKPGNENDPHSPPGRSSISHSFGRVHLLGPLPILDHLVDFTSRRNWTHRNASIILSDTISLSGCSPRLLVTVRIRSFTLSGKLDVVPKTLRCGEFRHPYDVGLCSTYRNADSKLNYDPESTSSSFKLGVPDSFRLLFRLQVGHRTHPCTTRLVRCGSESHNCQRDSVTVTKPA